MKLTTNQWETVAGAAFYAGVAAAAFARPAAIPALFGGAATTAASRTEIRAVYGGLPLAMAGIIVREAGRTARPMTRAIAILSGGMAGGRVLGATIEGEANHTTKAFIFLEAITAAGLAHAARPA